MAEMIVLFVASGVAAILCLIFLITLICGTCCKCEAKIGIGGIGSVIALVVSLLMAGLGAHQYDAVHGTAAPARQQLQRPMPPTLKLEGAQGVEPPKPQPAGNLDR